MGNGYIKIYAVIISGLKYLVTQNSSCCLLAKVWHVVFLLRQCFLNTWPFQPFSCMFLCQAWSHIVASSCRSSGKAVSFFSFKLSSKTSSCRHGSSYMFCNTWIYSQVFFCTLRVAMNTRTSSKPRNSAMPSCKTHTPWPNWAVWQDMSGSTFGEFRSHCWLLWNVATGRLPNTTERRSNWNYHNESGWFDDPLTSAHGSHKATIFRSSCVLFHSLSRFNAPLPSLMEGMARAPWGPPAK